MSWSEMGTRTQNYMSFFDMEQSERDAWVLARCSDKAKGRAMLAAYPSVAGQPVPEEDWDWNDDEDEDDWEDDDALSSSLSPDDDEPWDDVWEDG